MEKYEVIIIGAGTAGLTARRQVANVTNNYLVVDPGPLGTTCARVGCMPSKALIQIANDYHQIQKLKGKGVVGIEGLSIKSSEVMSHVRTLRDRFVRGVMDSYKGWEDKLVKERAVIISKNRVKIGSKIVESGKIVIATGSTPKMASAWNDFAPALITTDDFFELEQLPRSVAIIGLGVIGLEIGQALSKLGVEVIGVNQGRAIGGITDPIVQNYVNKKLDKEFPVHFGELEMLSFKNGLLEFRAENKTYKVEKALVTIGRSPNMSNVGLENLKIPLNIGGMPSIDKNTMSLTECPNIFVAGDSNSDRPILHEAADEGFIAGYNAGSKNIQCFKRRVPLGIIFSEPNLATIGLNYKELKAIGKNFVTGAVSFEGQGRSIVKLKEQGVLHVYVDSRTEKILGAEMQAPDGEHLAHLLAWVISLDLTVTQVLKLPFYHPVIEEGLRTALRDAHTLLHQDKKNGYELSRCDDPPIR